MMFETTQLPDVYDELAPDGSEVRLLLKRPGGSMAHFRLNAGACSAAVVHKTVDELWYVTGGAGELWRKQGDAEEVTLLVRDVCVSIPAGVAFQFRAVSAEPLEIVAVTMPPWSGNDEAQSVPGCKDWR